MIRKAAYQALAQSQALHGDVTLRAGLSVAAVRTGADASQVELSNGETLRARLVVAADSRFSSTRRMMGIPAQMHDFGKNMLVCCMRHDEPHHFAAWEWFDYGQTLALLPMNPDPETQAHRSSVVITLPSDAINHLMQLPPAEFNVQVAQRFKQRLGGMTLESTRHNYPLVSVFPERLVALRFATVGDAAVGMHPVTAHGFNFGLLSVQALTQEIARAQGLGQEIGQMDALMRYERQQTRATLPLFWMTRFIVELYTRESPPAKLMRKVLLHVGDRLTPFKQSIAASLAGR